MNTKRAAVVAALTVLSAGSAIAATDGEFGPTSTGSSDVSLTKEAAVQITGVEDVVIPAADQAAGDITASSDLCVYSTSAAYGVTVTSASGAFNLVAGSENLAYSLSWAGGAVTYNTPLTGQTGNTDPTCNGTDDTTFTITIAEADFNAALAGDYLDTLTFVVAAE